MAKKPSFLWALAVGLVFVVLQEVIFFVRFGRLDTEAPVTDLLIFFIGGLLIGLGLIYFIRRSENPTVLRAVLIAFVLSLPFALFGMVLGGVMGPLGVLIVGVSPSVFVIGLGYYISRAFVKK